jgi:hypothetical protein
VAVGWLPGDRLVAWAVALPVGVDVATHDPTDADAKQRGSAAVTLTISKRIMRCSDW